QGVVTQAGAESTRVPVRSTQVALLALDLKTARREQDAVCADAPRCVGSQRSSDPERAGGITKEDIQIGKCICGLKAGPHMNIYVGICVVGMKETWINIVRG